MDVMEHAWQTYRTSMIPWDLSPTQLGMLRRSFYAGAIVVHSAIMHCGAEDVSEEMAVGIMRLFSDALTDYTRAQGMRSTP